AGITLISDGTTVYECRSPEEVVDLLQGGQGVFGIAISGAFKEIKSSLSHLPVDRPAERAAAPDGAEASSPPALTGALAARRARRRAGCPPRRRSVSRCRRAGRLARLPCDATARSGGGDLAGRLRF